MKSLQSLSPKKTSLLGSLEPLAAVLTTVYWLKEPFGLLQWVGYSFHDWYDFHSCARKSWEQRRKRPV
nr:DMT family transporter [Roseburia sp. 1XD42-34]